MIEFAQQYCLKQIKNVPNFDKQLKRKQLFKAD